MMKALRTIHFPTFEDSNGVLGIYEGMAHVPFDIKRVFTVSANENDIRGEHAHKKCTQLLICVSGEIRVDCDDGIQVSQYLLSGLSKGLLIPPCTWAKEEYLTDNAVLMVLCDRGYEADDYIRDFEEFKNNYC
jgi:dTDP-4-dehydrorhamnose 3,5-epimerase-like enzyme